MLPGDDGASEMIAVAHPRALIRILVAIAMIFASVASAWAVSVNVGRGFPQHQQTSISHDKAMSDCERMAHGAKADTPDGKHESCADNFCMAKCFKVFGSIQPDELAVMMALSPHPLPLRFPAIWFNQPPFAPPRS